MLFGYESRFLTGMAVTAGVAVVALAVALALGLIGAAAKTRGGKTARSIAAVYTTITRGTPELLLILLIYFDMQRLLNFARESLGMEDTAIISPFWAGASAIGIIYGGYMTETFRGALLAVPPGQAEAGSALGLQRWRVFWLLTFPQMLRHALPGISNNWLVLLKATALVSVIGLSDDMMAVANQAKAKTREPFMFYLAAAGGYLVFTAISGFIFSRLEKRARRGLAREAGK